MELHGKIMDATMLLLFAPSPQVIRSFTYMIIIFIFFSLLLVINIFEKKKNLIITIIYIYYDYYNELDCIEKYRPLSNKINKRLQNMQKKHLGFTLS